MTATPNFFIVGTGKAGTTSLHQYLSQHPQIYMSTVKEPCYFASEIRPETFNPAFDRHIRLQSQSLPLHIQDGLPLSATGWIAGTWDDYLRLFANVKSESVVGESSAIYLWSETAAENIRKQIPEARIAMILRDPSERAFSQYMHLAAIGMTALGFREFIEQCARGGYAKLGPMYPFLQVGLYCRQVKRYLDLFPRDRVRIYWYEEDWRQPEALLRDLFEFLGVDREFVVDTSHRNHQRRAPKWLLAHYLLKKTGGWYPLKSLLPSALQGPLKKVLFRSPKAMMMTPEDRRFLVDYYRSDIVQLSELLGRDLSGWLRIS